MQLAIGVTEDDARREGVTALYERAGIIVDKGKERGIPLFQQFHGIADAACKLPTQAKKLTTDFDSLLYSIQRRGLSDQPEVTTTALDHAIRLAEQFREIASQFQEMAKSLPERVTERFPSATPTPDDPDDLSPQSVTVPVVTNAEGERFHADGVMLPRPFHVGRRLSVDGHSDGFARLSGLPLSEGIDGDCLISAVAVIEPLPFGRIRVVADDRTPFGVFSADRHHPQSENFTP